MAATGAKLGMPPAKLGLVYSHTGLRKFIDAIGVTRTRDLFFTGRNVSAATALEWGMVTEIAAGREARGARRRLRGRDRRQRAALAGRQQARDHASCWPPRAGSTPRSRRSSSRCARRASGARTSTKVCARSRRSGLPNGRGAKSRVRPGAARAARVGLGRGAPRARRAAARRVVRLRDLGPGAQADAEPRLAALGHAQARRHAPSSCCARYRDAHPDAPRVLVGDLSRRHGGFFGRRYGGLGHAVAPERARRRRLLPAPRRPRASGAAPGSGRPRAPPRSSSTASSRPARSRSTSARVARGLQRARRKGS